MRRQWQARLTSFAREWAFVVALGTVALLGIAKVGEDVLARESTGFDGAVQRWIMSHQYHALDVFFFWLTTAGGITGMCVLAAVAAAYLWHRGRPRVGIGVLITPALAVSLFAIAKHAYARPRPLGLGGIVPSSYSFPSGHSTASAAVCCTLAYVYWREGIVGRRSAILFATLAPLLIGISRVYLNVHWTTDVLGGWSAGLLVAVLSVALYDRNRRRRVAGRSAATSLTSEASR